eukprot:scaffold182115_cov23-Tisochrysis_lutea.AAC.1
MAGREWEWPLFLFIVCCGCECRRDQDLGHRWVGALANKRLAASPRRRVAAGRAAPQPQASQRLPLPPGPVPPRATFKSPPPLFFYNDANS